MSLSDKDIQRLLSQTFLAQVQHHALLPSTSDHARSLVEAGQVQPPLLIVADAQSAGRGRGNHCWWTGQGSLAMTLVLDGTDIGPSQRGRLPLAVALAVIDVAQPLVPDHHIGLKWPNDVVIASRKLAGVLVESLPDGQLFIGLGVNTNNTLEDAPDALRCEVVTLRDLTGRPQPHGEFLFALITQLETAMEQLTQDEDDLTRRWNERCAHHNHRVTLQCIDQSVTGRCCGIAPSGALLLETGDGVKTFHSGTLTDLESQPP